MRFAPYPCCQSIAGIHLRCPLFRENGNHKLSKAQRSLLVRAAANSLPGDGVPVRGPAAHRVAAALRKRGLLSDDDLVAKVTPEGKKLGEFLAAKAEASNVV